jgi:hypothetical protein
MSYTLSKLQSYHVSTATLLWKLLQMSGCFHNLPTRTELCSGLEAVFGFSLVAEAVKQYESLLRDVV